MRCYGILLHGWDAKVFENIGNRLGKFVRVSTETFNKSSLEFGRVCVQVDLHKFIKEVLFVGIFGLKYKCQ